MVFIAHWYFFWYLYRWVSSGGLVRSQLLIHPQLFTSFSLMSYVNVVNQLEIDDISLLLAAFFCLSEVYSVFYLTPLFFLTLSLSSMRWTILLTWLRYFNLLASCGSMAIDSAGRSEGTSRRGPVKLGLTRSPVGGKRGFVYFSTKWVWKVLAPANCLQLFSCSQNMKLVARWWTEALVHSPALRFHTIIIKQ